MVSPYKKDFNDLDDAERDMLATSRQVLRNGDRLYGLTPEDVSHIEYALGMALHRLKQLYEGDAIATLIEIGKDSDGYFVTFIYNEDIDKKPEEATYLS